MNQNQAQLDQLDNSAELSASQRRLAAACRQKADSLRHFSLVVDKTKAAMTEENEAAKARQGFKQSVMNATLTARIKSQLLANGNIGGMAINVDSKE